jgi:tripeptidyl-peptidase-1
VTAVGASSLSPSSTTSSTTNDVVYGSTATAGGAEIPSSGGNAYGNQVTSGGGFSCLFAAESYQTSQIATYQDTSGYFAGTSEGAAAGDSSTCAFSSTTSTTFNAAGRGYPDVVALGWQYEITLGGDALPGIAGTSAASPVVAGMFTIINGLRLAAGKPPVGFINTALYSSSAPSDIFNKLAPGSDDQSTNACTTSGSGCCTMGFASAGSSGAWDAYRGLGSLNFPALSTYFQGL